MNPQNNNPMNGGQPSGQNFDGFGGPNISYENYAAPQPQQQQQVPLQPALKMVDYLWQRIVYCALAFSTVLLIGLIVAVILVGTANGSTAVAESERDKAQHDVRGLYEILGVDSQEDAVKVLTDEEEYLNGGDLMKIDNLLNGKYPAYDIDYASSNINFVRMGNVYKVVSVGIMTNTGTKRVVLYGRIANGEWKLGGFDSDNKVDPCANSSDEEKEAIAGIFTCGEPMEEEKEKKTDDKDNKKTDDEKTDEEKKDDE
ncbi:MAG: hypothetical protein MJ155_01755 [Candidatus Saccharibacteria bacterium]|nr:hypothetical protein [Candidatus Saccharibacteria bacterium]